MSKTVPERVTAYLNTNREKDLPRKLLPEKMSRVCAVWRMNGRMARLAVMVCPVRECLLLCLHHHGAGQRQT